MLQQDPFGAVARPDAGAIARAQPEACQSASGAGDFAVELTPGEADVLMADDQRFTLLETRGGIADSLRNRLL